MEKFQENELRSPLSLFYQWERETPDLPFLRQPSGEEWTEMTYGEAGKEIRRMAEVLRSKGLGRGSHIGILSKNCTHWVLADLAISMAGAVSVPFFANLTAAELGEVVRLGDVEALFVGKIENWESQKTELPEEVQIIRFPHYPGAVSVQEGEAWDALVSQADPVKGEPHPDWDDIWTIVFTSGTTGTPKGVVHDYRNIGTLIANEFRHHTIGFSNSMGKARHFSYLPLNHVADRIALSGTLMSGGSISFAESLDTFAANLQATRPTIFLAVPRIWSRFQAGVFEKIPPKRLDTLLRIPIISGLVKRRILGAMGLGSVKTCITSTAITPEPVKQWFGRLGVVLTEVYGMTECLGPFTAMPKGERRTDSVGKPLPNSEGGIDPETREILIRVPWMMKGYYKDQEQTAQVLKGDWLHTGDHGDVDEEGFFRVLGRVRDTFKTSKGKFVVPSQLEDHFAESELISQVCVMGLGLNQPVGLVVLSEIARQLDQSHLQEALTELYKQVNARLHRYERLSHLIMVPEQWSDQNHFLTPTLKLRRNVIREHYEDALNRWVSMESGLVWEL